MRSLTGRVAGCWPLGELKRFLERTAGDGEETQARLGGEPEEDEGEYCHPSCDISVMGDRHFPERMLQSINANHIHV